MMRTLSCFLITVLSLACTKGVPEFEDLGKELEGPKFSGKTETVIQVTDPNAKIPVNGQCDIKIQNLEYKIADFTSYKSISDSEISSLAMNCASGSFSFELPSLNAMAYWSTSESIRFNVYLRGETIAGPTTASKIIVLYDPPGKSGLPGFRVTSGGGISSSTNFDLKSQITTTDKPKAQSANYFIQ